MNIKLHIERLVLDGLPVTRSQGPQVQVAMEAELARLMAEGGLAQELASGGALPSVLADGIKSVGGSPAQIGRQIAKAVYGGIGK
jgi:hypothetical protein